MYDICQKVGREWRLVQNKQTAAECKEWIKKQPKGTFYKYENVLEGKSE